MTVETYQARHPLLRMTNVGIRRLWLTPRYISFGVSHLLVMIDQVGLWRASARKPSLSVIDSSTDSRIEHHPGMAQITILDSDLGRHVGVGGKSWHTR